MYFSLSLIVYWKEPEKGLRFTRERDQGIVHVRIIPIFTVTINIIL